MRPPIVVIALVAMLAAVLATDPAKSIQIDENKKDLGVQTNGEVSKLFDFEPFKRAYHKHYNSTMEEMRRLKRYLACCYRVFISAVSYSHRLRPYYLRVSEWADSLPEEIEAGKNKFAGLSIPPNAEILRDSKVGGESATDAVNREGAHVAPKEQAHGPDESTQTKLKRKKRNTEGPRPGFRIAQAFELETDEAPAKEDTPPEGSPLMCLKGPGSQRVVYSSLPDYKATKAMQLKRSDGRSYDHLPVKANYKQLSLPGKWHRMFQSDEQLARQFAAQRGGSSKNGDNGEDVLWMDHRICGCFQPVQNQGLCGSCYAFAVVGFIEWLHCSTTTERIKLSEQYVVDCGPLLDDKLHGCSGANYFNTGEFMSNFGLEPAESYPYFGFENKCPHEPGSDMHSMGYLRADVSKAVVIGMESAEHYLDKWVIAVNMHATDDFMWYGGGVWVGKTCGDKDLHSVLIVGHGREDGEEYWLIRNSHGVSWGERGYMKLNKNSKCIDQSLGYIFGTSDGWDLHMTLKRNDKVAEPLKPKPGLMSSVFNPLQTMRVLTNNS